MVLGERPQTTAGEAAAEATAEEKKKNARHSMWEVWNEERERKVSFLTVDGDEWEEAREEERVEGVDAGAGGGGQGRSKKKTKGKKLHNELNDLSAYYRKTAIAASASSRNTGIAASATSVGKSSGARKTVRMQERESIRELRSRKTTEELGSDDGRTARRSTMKTDRVSIKEPPRIKDSVLRSAADVIKHGPADGIIPPPVVPAPPRIPMHVPPPTSAKNITEQG